jgi:DNA-binding transcriptional regulator YiaG
MEGHEVKRLRKRLDMTQTDFAKLIGVHRVTVTRWETDPEHHKIPARMAKLIRLIVNSKAGK